MHQRRNFYAEDGAEFRDENQKARFRVARKHGLRYCKLSGTSDWDYKIREIEFKATIRRSDLNILGDFFLIALMLIMMLYPVRNNFLIIASISTLVFAIFVSLFSKAREHEVLGIVAAYAAVLVIFVETSFQSSPT
jgi:hypothetical protein